MILGLTLRKLEASKDADLGKGVSITNTPRIMDVTEKRLEALGKDALSITFGYSCVYKAMDAPGKAAIEMEGEAVYVEEDNKKILGQWKNGQKLPADFAASVINAVLRKCVTKAIVLAEELQLPPPIDYPHVKAGPPAQKNATGAG